jgi:hypothetical protein
MTTSPHTETRGTAAGLAVSALVFAQMFTLVFALVFALESVPATAAEEFVIASGGAAKATIALLPDSGAVAERAAADLAATLAAMTGGTVGMADDPLAKTPLIVVGQAAAWAKLAGDDAALKRLADAAPESFLMLSSPRRLLLLGKDAAGTSHAVATLLHDLGCRWYFITKDWEVIPRRPDLAVKADRVESPALKVRILSNGAGAGASSRLFETWCRRNRLGSAYGDKAVHHSYAGFVPKTLFKDHPDWFAKISKDGEAEGTEQNGEQPCTTHPEVVKRVTEGVVEKLRRQKETTGQVPAIVSVSPNDGTPNMCRCSRCIAAGSYGDCALLLANQAAEAIRNEFPGTVVGFLAYGRASALPEKVKRAEPNVLASVATNFNWKTSVPRLIQEWPRIVKHVTIYDYYAIAAWGSQAPDNEQPTVEQISRSLRGWHAAGIEGVNAEMENDWATCGHRFWAFARSAWDPAADPKQVMEDFLTNAWGPAAAPMRRFYARWENGEKASQRVLRLAFADLEEAAKLAADDPAVLRRVDQMSIYLYWYLLDREFKATKDEEEQNRIALEGDLLQYRWRDAFMVQLTPSLFTVDRPARIGFTPQEVAELRRTAVKRFLPGTDDAVDVASVGIAQDLVPVAKPPKPGTERGPLLDYYGAASYLFRAKAGEKVDVVFAAEIKTPPAKGAPAAAQQQAADRDPLPMEDAGADRFGRFQLWFLGEDGTAESYVLERNPADPSGRPLSFSFTAAHDGLYRLNARLKNGGSRADFAGRPHVIAAPLRERKNLLAAYRQAVAVAPGGSGRGFLATHYLFVPEGTRAFVVKAAAPGRKELKPVIKDPAGKVVSEAAVRPDEDLIVTVPAGKDGGVWSVGSDAGTLRIGLGGVPPFLATSPEALLVPREKSR